jgi:hypothetical protein
MGRRDVARRTGAQGRTNDGRGSKDAQQQGFKDASKAADAQPKARTEGERAPQASGSAGASASPGTPASPKAPGAAASGDATPGAPGAPGSGKKRRRRGRGGKGRGSGNGGTPGNTAPNTDLHSPREAEGNDAGGADSDADD